MQKTCKANNNKNKTAIIYCRAANKEDAKRQQTISEARAKELNAEVKAVFVDILHMQKQTVWRQFIQILRKHQPQKASSRAGWRETATYYRKHKVGYIITQDPSRFSRIGEEYLEMIEDIKRHGACLVFSGTPQKDMIQMEKSLINMAKALS